VPSSVTHTLYEPAGSMRNVTSFERGAPFALELRFGAGVVRRRIDFERHSPIARIRLDERLNDDIGWRESRRGEHSNRQRLAGSGGPSDRHHQPAERHPAQHCLHEVPLRVQMERLYADRTPHGSRQMCVLATQSTDRSRRRPPSPRRQSEASEPKPAAAGCAGTQGGMSERMVVKKPGPSAPSAPSPSDLQYTE